MRLVLTGVLVEAAVVVVAGLAVALAANQISPAGLSLTRNYFPAGKTNAPAAAAPVRVSATVNNTNEPSASSEAADIADRLRDKGLQGILLPEVKELLRDAGYIDGRIVFVDARDEEHFQDGHIPGAHQLNPYHPEKELGPLLPICQAAQKVVVYCMGGDCEDSDTDAIILRDAGVPAKNIFVYGGGYEEWTASHLQIETGARNSGKIGDAQ